MKPISLMAFKFVYGRNVVENVCPRDLTSKWVYFSDLQGQLFTQSKC